MSEYHDQNEPLHKQVLKVKSLLTRYPIVPILILAALLLSGLALRFYDLTDQPIDFHPTRQLRGAIIARGMYYEMLPSADPSLPRASRLFLVFHRAVRAANTGKAGRLQLPAGRRRVPVDLTDFHLDFLDYRRSCPV